MIVLETQRLLLRRRMPEEPTADKLTAGYPCYVVEHEDPDVPFELSRETVLSSYFSAKQGDPFDLYDIYPKGSDRSIGYCPLTPCLCSPEEVIRFRPDLATIPPYHILEVEIGWALSMYHRGHGYATEAPRALIDHGFGTLNVARIVAFTGRDNRASSRIMERLE